MSLKFPQGTKVKLKKTSGYYHQAPGVLGTVDEDILNYYGNRHHMPNLSLDDYEAMNQLERNRLWMHVKWDENHRPNAYTERDLEIVVENGKNEDYLFLLKGK